MWNGFPVPAANPPQGFYPDRMGVPMPSTSDFPGFIGQQWINEWLHSQNNGIARIANITPTVYSNISEKSMLTTFSNAVATSNEQHTQEQINTIIECVTDADLDVNQKAVNMLLTMNIANDNVLAKDLQKVQALFEGVLSRLCQIVEMPSGDDKLRRLTLNYILCMREVLRLKNVFTDLMCLNQGLYKQRMVATLIRLLERLTLDNKRPDEVEEAKKYTDFLSFIFNKEAVDSPAVKLVNSQRLVEVLARLIFSVPDVPDSFLFLFRVCLGNNPTACTMLEEKLNPPCSCQLLEKAISRLDNPRNPLVQRKFKLFLRCIEAIIKTTDQGLSSKGGFERLSVTLTRFLPMDAATTSIFQAGLSTLCRCSSSTKHLKNRSLSQTVAMICQTLPGLYSLQQQERHPSVLYRLFSMAQDCFIILRNLTVMNAGGEIVKLLVDSGYLKPSHHNLLSLVYNAALQMLAAITQTESKTMRQVFVEILESTVTTLCQLNNPDVRGSAILDSYPEKGKAINDLLVFIVCRYNRLFRHVNVKTIAKIMRAWQRMARHNVNSTIFNPSIVQATFTFFGDNAMSANIDNDLNAALIECIELMKQLYENNWVDTEMSLDLNMRALKTLHDEVQKPDCTLTICGVERILELLLVGIPKIAILIMSDVKMEMSELLNGLTHRFNSPSIYQKAMQLNELLANTGDAVPLAQYYQE